MKKEKFRDYELFLRENELSENTIDSYLHNLSTYVEIMGDEFTKEKIVEFKWKMLKERKAKTVNHYITALKSYCKFRDIECDIKKVKIQKMNYIENVISLDQFNVLVDNLKNEGKKIYAAYFLIPAKTGARVSEFLKFRKKDIDRGYAEFFTKGKVRTIYFPKKLLEEIRETFKDLKEEDFLFQNRYKRIMTQRGFDSLFKSYAKKYGIPKELAHAHGLRHLFAKEFLKRNPDISLLADLLGHSGVNTTMIYTRNSKEEQIEKLDKAVDW